MKETYVITSGCWWIDMDALACVCACKELFTLQGHDVRAVVTTNLNASVTKKFRNLSLYEKDTEILDRINHKKYVLVDISEYEHFERFVDVECVSQIFDHHHGFEKFWNDKIGKNAVIEPLGAAATLIVREFKKYHLLDKISAVSAEMLATAIISNSLNFQAKITKEEDKQAYRELQQYFDYKDDFEQEYFTEVQNAVEDDIESAIRDDRKVINGNIYTSQLEVWDASHILENLLPAVEKMMNEDKNKYAFINIIDLSKKRNVIQFRDRRSLEWMQDIFPQWQYDTARNQALTEHVILRKEILPHIQEGK